MQNVQMIYFTASSIMDLLGPSLAILDLFRPFQAALDNFRPSGRISDPFPSQKKGSAKGGCPFLVEPLQMKLSKKMVNFDKKKTSYFYVWKPVTSSTPPTLKLSFHFRSRHLNYLNYQFGLSCQFPESYS